MKNTVAQLPHRNLDQHTHVSGKKSLKYRLDRIRGRYHHSTPNNGRATTTLGHSNSKQELERQAHQIWREESHEPSFALTQRRRGSRSRELKTSTTRHCQTLKTDSGDLQPTLHRHNYRSETNNRRSTFPQRRLRATATDHLPQCQAYQRRREK